MEITSVGLGLWLIVLGFVDDSVVSMGAGILLVMGFLVVV
jgi:hypothetical protein